MTGTGKLSLADAPDRFPSVCGDCRPEFASDGRWTNRVYPCPLHAQAPAMREALKSLLMEIGLSASAGEIAQSNAPALKEARAILKAIEP